MQRQQGDVLLFQTNDDGDIIVEGGVVTMSGGLEVSAYLALFGGNEDDDSSQKTPNQYWGNLDENESSRKYRSKTQFLLSTIPPIPANLPQLQDAATNDLDFFITDKIASSVNVVVSMPGLNRVKFVITIEAQGFESEFEFVENWKASTDGT